MPSRSTLGKSAILALVLTAASLSLLAQGFYGSILGVVSDASGAAMPGASVTLLNIGTGDRRTASTGADGTYRFVNLVPGNYRVEIEQSGFKRYTRDQIAVNVDAAVRVDVGMQLGDVTQAVD